MGLMWANRSTMSDLLQELASLTEPWMALRPAMCGWSLASEVMFQARPTWIEESASIQGLVIAVNKPKELCAGIVTRHVIGAGIGGLGYSLVLTLSLSLILFFPLLIHPFLAPPSVHHDSLPVKGRA